MRLRPTHVLAAATIGLLALTGCSGDDDPADGAAAEQSTPAEEPSSDDGDEPSVEPSDEPSEDASPPDEGVLSESCAEIEQALTDAQDAASEAITDPASAQEVLSQISEDLRAAAEGTGPEIEGAVEELAMIYDGFAEALQSGEIPDLDNLADAATALAEACRP